MDASGLIPGCDNIKVPVFEILIQIFGEIFDSNPEKDKTEM